jgi:hypothetical protein
MSSEDDEVLSPLAESTGDASRVAIALAAGPLPKTRTSHSSLDVGAAAVTLAASVEVLRCCCLRDDTMAVGGTIADVVVVVVAAVEEQGEIKDDATTPFCDDEGTKALVDVRDPAMKTTAV